LPRDPLQTNYEYAELLGLTAANHGPLSAWIGEIAAAAAKSPAVLAACPGAAPAPECLHDAARSFVSRAFRGDVSADRAGRIADFFASSARTVGFAQATADLVEVVLNSPDFLFRRETTTTSEGRLAPVQHLQAMTYTLADAPPDALGLEPRRAAETLRDAAAVGGAVAAIVATAPAREKLLRFLKAWLEIRDPADFTISSEVFPEFSPRLAARMVAETEAFLRRQLSQPAPKLKDVTQAVDPTGSGPQRPRFAMRIDDAGNPVSVPVAPQQRLGVFSQPAFLASHSGPTSSRPIKRGVFWARKAMCMELEPPPKDLHAKLYDDAGHTERERIEAATKAGACAGCHKIINPFAFFQENYDALGRWRTLENGYPVDSRILIDFLEARPIRTAGPVEALRTFTLSAEFKQCFVRQLFRFYMGRNEEPSDDPLLRRMFLAFVANDEQDLVTMISMLGASDRLSRRQ
jgi:hypothetical protein